MRGFVKFLAGLVIILAVIWLGLWWYAQSRLDAGMAAYLQRMSTDSREQITYDSIVSSHSPLVASVSLVNPRWTVQPDPAQPGVGISATRIGVRIDALDPLEMHADLPAQFNVTTPRGGFVVTIGTSNAVSHLTARALFSRKTYPFTGADMSATDIDILVGGTNLSAVQIGGIAVHEDFNGTASNAQTALNVTENIDNIALSPILVRLSNIPFDGKITRIGISAQLSGPVNWQQTYQQLNAIPSEPARRQFLIKWVHDWAANGGNGKASVTLALGPSTLKATGSVAFDANAQPSGTADVTADHLDAFTAAITGAYPQTQQSVGDIEAQLSPYLTTTDASGQVLNLHIAYGKPGVVVNGSRKADMPPIDWTALENPPAPVAVAPGDGSGAAAAGP